MSNAALGRKRTGRHSSGDGPSTRTERAMSPDPGWVSFDSRSESPEGIMSRISKAYSASTALPVDKVMPLMDDDIVIAVMGPTGAGKSTFISKTTKHDVKIGDSLTSCTTDIGIIRLPSQLHSRDGYGDLVLVDTPGFDDTNTSDVDILRMIYEWLKTSNVKLSGLLYFHRISDNRMAGTPLRNLGMFEKLCGKNMFDSVILVTTMWDDVDFEIGQQREKELKEKYWKVMMHLGSETKPFLPDRPEQDRFKLLESLVSVAVERNQKRRSESPQRDRAGFFGLFPRQKKNNPKVRAVLLQDEANKGTKLPNTSAGRQLYSKLEFIADKRQELLQRMQQEVEASEVEGDHQNMKTLMEELEKIQKEFQEISVEMQRMKVPMGQRWRRLIGLGRG